MKNLNKIFNYKNKKIKFLIMYLYRKNNKNHILKLIQVVKKKNSMNKIYINKKMLKLLRINQAKIVISRKIVLKQKWKIENKTLKIPHKI